ncbi:MAG: hypothetical protein KDD04_03870, partial [Sinomicrobium sp.]|nr:hypothetical protein [Sinomicrobium sp.]
MKGMRSIFLGLLIIVLAQTSCRREDEEVIPTDNCFIAANVDGQDYRWELNNCALNDQKLRVGNIASDEAELTLEPVTAPATFQSDDTG